MIAIMPSVRHEDDRPPLPMSSLGSLRGFDLHRAVWLFGFQVGSLLAAGFGVATNYPLWVLALFDGSPLETWRGRWDDRPPRRFLTVVYGTLPEHRHASLTSALK